MDDFEISRRALETQHGEARLIMAQIRRDLDGRNLEPRRLRQQLDRLDTKAVMIAGLIRGLPEPEERRAAPEPEAEAGWPTLFAVIAGGKS